MKRLLEWQIATVTDIKQETPRVKTFTLTLPGWMADRPGQHYDIRLTAPDGYQAQRSYSIASEPERANQIDITIEKLDDGEVSSYMHDVIVEGDLVEVRGPIGGYFVWSRPRRPTLTDRRRLRCGSSNVDATPACRSHLAYPNTPPLQRAHTRRRNLPRRTGTITGRRSSTCKSSTPTLARNRPTGQATPAASTRKCSPKYLVPLARSLISSFAARPLWSNLLPIWSVQFGIHPANIRTERFGPSGS